LHARLFVFNASFSGKRASVTSVGLQVLPVQIKTAKQTSLP